MTQTSTFLFNLLQVIQRSPSTLSGTLIIEKNRKEIERKLIAKKTEPKQSFDLWIPNLSLKSLNKTKVNFKRMIDTFIPSFH